MRSFWSILPLSSTVSFIIKTWCKWIETSRWNCCCLVAKSYSTLCDCIPRDSSGISQARILEWVAISSSRGSYQLKYQTQASCISCVGRWILYHWATEEACHIVQVKLNSLVALKIIWRYQYEFTDYNIFIRGWNAYLF